MTDNTRAQYSVLSSREACGRAQPLAQPLAQPHAKERAGPPRSLCCWNEWSLCNPAFSGFPTRPLPGGAPGLGYSAAALSSMMIDTREGAAAGTNGQWTCAPADEDKGAEGPPCHGAHEELRHAGLRQRAGARHAREGGSSVWGAGGAGGQPMGNTAASTSGTVRAALALPAAEPCHGAHGKLRPPFHYHRAPAQS